MMKMRKLWGMLLLLVSLLLAGAVSVSADDDDVKPRKVTIAKASITVMQGKEFEIKAKMTPLNADDDYLRWEIISGKGVVKFDDDDRNDDEIELKAVKAGTAKLRCYVKGRSKSKYGDVITIKVKKAANEKITKSGSLTRTVELGDDFELKVKKNSSVDEDKLKWKISNTKIVRFDDDDRNDDEVEFKARKEGTTKITCSYKASNGKTLKVTYTIRVVDVEDDDDDDRDDDRDDDDDDDDNDDRDDDRDDDEDDRDDDD